MSKTECKAVLVLAYWTNDGRFQQEAIEADSLEAMESEIALIRKTEGEIFVGRPHQTNKPFDPLIDD